MVSKPNWNTVNDNNDNNNNNNNNNKNNKMTGMARYSNDGNEENHGKNATKFRWKLITFQALGFIFYHVKY